MASTSGGSPSVAQTHLSLEELKALSGDTASTAPTYTNIYQQSSSLVRNAILLLSAALCAGFALAGLTVLIYVVATTNFSPRQLSQTFQLPLDISGNELTSQIALQSHVTDGNSFKNTVPSPNPKFLSPGQRFDAWLELKIPDLFLQNDKEKDFVHIVGEFLASDGSVTAKATQPFLLRSRRSLVWYLVRFPLHWVGLGDGSTIVSLLLFSKHQEQQKDKLSVVFKLSIKSRTSTCPDVLGAHLHVKWRVGLIRTLLYYMRPYSLLGLLIGIAAVTAIIGGSIGALLCLVLLRMPGSISQGGSRASAGGSTGDLLSVQTTPRDIRLSSDEDSDSGHASPLRSGRDGDSNQMETSPRPLRPWEVLLKQLPEPTPRADNTLHSTQNASHKALFSDDNDSAMSTGAKFGYGRLIARDTGSSRAGT